MRKWIYLLDLLFVLINRNLLKHTSVTEAFFQHAAMVKNYND